MATLRRITPIDGGVNYTFRIEFHNRGHLCEAAMCAGNPYPRILDR
jgi:hypothetical protein